MEHKIILKIAEPCKECWSTMKPCDVGMFCQVCETDVLDFTDLADDEVVEILKYSTKKVCGRFKTSQLNRPFVISNYTVKSANPRYAKMLAAVLLFAGSGSFLSAQDVAVPNQVVATAQPKSSSDSKPRGVTKTDGGWIVTGVVLDELDELIPGVVISLKEDRTKGVITDLDGCFEFKIPDQYWKNERVEIEISFIGFESQYLIVTTSELKETLKVKLKESQMLIGEVIVIPYNKYDDPIYDNKR